MIENPWSLFINDTSKYNGNLTFVLLERYDIKDTIKKEFATYRDDWSTNNIFLNTYEVWVELKAIHIVV